MVCTSDFDSEGKCSIPFRPTIVVCFSNTICYLRFERIVNKLAHGVMVTQQFLELLLQVRILLGQRFVEHNIYSFRFLVIFLVLLFVRMVKLFGLACTKAGEVPLQGTCGEFDSLRVHI